MSNKIVSREEWLEARKSLLTKEKAFSRQKAKRAMQAMMTMKKIDIAALQRAVA